jgi:TRAP-type mannitol/chloroaromatic compound transport system permease small subunit
MNKYLFLLPLVLVIVFIALAIIAASLEPMTEATIMKWAARAGILVASVLTGIIWKDGRRKPYYGEEE